jgi:branched-chain amino acid transport system substrate-binding protein
LVNAAAAQAESLECPCIADFVPWRSFVFDRGGSVDKPFAWTYAHAFGVEDLAEDFLQMWDQVPTNKTVGLVFADDAYGQMWSSADVGLPSVAGLAGYECVLTTPYAHAATDFTPQLADLVKGGCEICCGAMNTEDLITLWTQAHDQGYMPKIVTMADALLFPEALDALGQSGLHMTSGGLWLRDWPFRDSITGATAMELAQDYMNHTGEQWTAAIGQYAKFEWAVDVFRRMANILDKNDIIARVRTTRLETCAGLIDFTAPTSPLSLASSEHPVENVYKAPVCGIQWVEGLTFSYEPRLAGNRSDPELQLDGPIDPMEYS